jgi:acetyl-CoA carboxylase biotin carboxyl carrier protein
MDLDKDLIRELAALLEETGLSEIEISEDDKHIRVARGGTAVVSSVAAAPVAAAEPEGRGPVEPASHPGAITSPMVGTAYMSPDPNSAPFVSVGDTVREGQTLLIVEAMKTMNAIPAPRAGKVTQIMVTDEQPVEYDEVLMIIE